MGESMKQKTLLFILIPAILTLFPVPDFAQDKEEKVFYTGIMLFLKDKKDFIISLLSQ